MGGLSARDLAARLAQTPPADVPALRLLLELEAEPDVPDVVVLLARRQAIGEALEALDRQVAAARGIVKRCERLRPIPSRRVPAGI